MLRGMAPEFFPPPRHWQSLGGFTDSSHWITPAAIAASATMGDFRSPEAYRITLSETRNSIEIGGEAALPHVREHLRQWQAGDPARTPCGILEDAPAFARRGFMLDVSRCKVPTLASLLDWVDLLARFRFNELQLYTEHTFAYPDHGAVWRGASPITPADIAALQAACKEKGIDLVPNQNSFGHFERWLRHPGYKRYAECPDGFVTPWGEARREGMVLKPDADSLALVLGLHDVLLPLFDSPMANIGCDETFELGQGASKDECARHGMPVVYTDFVRKIAGHVRDRHGKTPQFWADVLINHPERLGDLPKEMIALAWGYEADSPYARDTERCRASGLQFYVCPGSSSWNSFGGRSANMVANIREAAVQGQANGAMGFLLTDWGDNGHLQQEPVTWPALAWSALNAWNPERADEATAWAWCDAAAFGGETGATEKWLALGRASDLLEWNPGNGNALFALFLNRPVWRKGFPKLADASLRKVLGHLAALPCPAGHADAWRQTRANLALGALKELHRRGQEPDPTARVADARAEHARLWRARNREGGLAESLSHYDPPPPGSPHE
jgi:hexosaminidase